MHLHPWSHVYELWFAANLPSTDEPKDKVRVFFCHPYLQKKIPAKHVFHKRTPKEE